MANLQKVVKVTQAQYDVLASGGTVGGYTGLDDNYIYLIEDNNEYLPITGGSIINNGTVIFRNGGASSSERFELNGETHDDYSIIYLPTTSGQQLEDINLFGDNDGAIIYSQQDDYHDDITFNTCTLIINDALNTNNSITFEPETYMVYHTEGQTQYGARLPMGDGTLALESYVQANPSNPTAALSSIQIGNTKYSVSSANYYPTAISWINGTTAGPTGTMTMSGTSNISIPAIPAATTQRSGVVTTAAQAFAGAKEFYAYTVFYDRIYPGYNIETNSNGSTIYLMRDYSAGRRTNKFSGFYANSAERNYFYGLAGNSDYICKCNYKGDGGNSVSPAADGLWECARANNETYGRSGHLAALFDSSFTTGSLFPVTDLSTRPVIITIEKTNTAASIDATDVCYLELTGWRYDGGTVSSNPYYGTLTNYKVELLLQRDDNNAFEWVKTFERTNVTDYIHGTIIPIWSNIAGVQDQYKPTSSSSYKYFYGIRLTISGATAGGIGNNRFGFTEIRLMEGRPAGIPADGVGALPLTGGKVLGDIIISNKYSDLGLKTQTNNSGIIGASDKQFYAVYAQNYYENGTVLSDRYLGKTATAADSNKLGGLAASLYVTTNTQQSILAPKTFTNTISASNNGDTPLFLTYDNDQAFFLEATDSASGSYRMGFDSVGLSQDQSYSFPDKSGVIALTDDAVKLTEITWSNLKALRDSGNLIPGMQYRITDYATTTAQANTSSAGHQFDIIVTADSTNALNEKARAALHSGDTYFANSELDAWELWYSLDNNAARFGWAFFKYIEVQLSSYNKVNFYRAAEFDDLSQPYGYAWLRIPDTLQRKVYTNTDTPTLETKAYSSMSGEDESYDINIVNNEEGKGVIYRMIDEFGNDVPYDFKNILFTKSEKYTNVYTFAYTVDSTIKDVSLLGLNRGCYFNVIKKWMSSSRQSLNFNVFYSTGGTFQCYGNMLERCRNNTFSGDNHYNMLENDCSGNTFGTQCSYNTLGMGCSDNTFGQSCSRNIFGNNCSNNTYERACSNNTFGNGCSNNTFGSSFSNNTFRNGCSNNAFGSNCRFNTFGNDCRYIVFGDSSSTIDYCQDIIIDNGCKYLYINSTDTTPSSSNYLQNTHIHLGISGSSSSNRQTITIPDRNLAYETEIVKDNSVKIVVS